MSLKLKLLGLLLCLPLAANAATVTFVAATADTGGTPNDSAAFTPALNDLLVVCVEVSSSVDTGIGSLTSSVGGFTFTLVGTDVSGAVDTLYCYVSDALVSSATSQTVTWSQVSDLGSGSVISVYRVSGITKTGSSAILQFDGDHGALGATPSIVFPGSVTTGNPTILALINSSNPAGVTQPTSWTEDADTGFNNPTSGMETASRNSGFTGTTVTWGSNSATGWAAFGLEIDSASAGPVFTAGPTVGTVTTTTIPLTATSDTTGNWKAVACPNGQTYPTVTQVLAGNCTGDIAAAASFNQGVVATVGDSDTLTGLSAGTIYDVHSAIDATPDSAAISTNADVTTNSLPTFTAGPSAGAITSTTIPVTFTVDQTGTVYGVACPDGQANPTVSQVKLGKCTGDVAAVSAWSEAVVATVSDGHSFTGLTASTTYDTHYVPNSTVNGDAAAITSLADQTTSAAAATVFTVGPSVAAAANGFTISGTVTCTGTCSVEAVACNPGDAAPTSNEIEAGQCGGGNAAIMNNQENWTTGVSDNFLLTSANKPVRFNVYVSATNGTTDTSVVPFNNQNRSARSGYAIAVLASLSATGIADCATCFADGTSADSHFTPDIAIGDVIEYEDDTNESSDCNISIGTDGELVFTPVVSTECDTRISFEVSYQDVSSATDGLFNVGTFATDETIYNGNTAPLCVPTQADETILLIEDADMGTISASTVCTDVDADAQTFTVSSGTIPVGTSLASSGAWTGTPSTENESGASLTFQDCDIAGECDTYDLISYVVNTWAAPNCIGDSAETCANEIVLAAPWRADSIGLTIGSQTCSLPPADVIAQQNPSPASPLDPFDPITISISIVPVMPDLVGLTVEQAAAALAALCD